ncbi:hypothetical protein GCM10010390_25260 [Streptomyces mordarskii]|uniref:Uncharacterized protein n=1 Tax=Streptomyces mordarskii TaxID=1226758 RepID=A0ABN1CMA1_9ACTN
MASKRFRRAAGGEPAEFMSYEVTGRVEIGGQQRDGGERLGRCRVPDPDAVQHPLERYGPMDALVDALQDRLIGGRGRLPGLPPG